MQSQMQPVYGEAWETAAKKGTSAERGGRRLDLAALLSVIHGNRAIFATKLSPVDQAYATELREMRNRWAHQEPISADDTDRAFGTAARLLQSIKADEEVRALEALRGRADPHFLNGLVQIARIDSAEIYTEESLDYEAARKDGNYLVFKSYDSQGRVVNVKIHVDIVIEGAFGEIPADRGFNTVEGIE